jgi:CHAD domain-containing protein
MSSAPPAADATVGRNPRGVAIKAVRDALDGAVQRLLAADPVARIGDDPEGVHQARVATRRLRSDLRTFAPLLDPVWVASLQGEVTWLGRELGVARESEVLLGHLRARARTLPTTAQHDVCRMIEQAAGDRAAAHARVVDVLRSARYLDLVDRLVQGAIAPRVRPEALRASRRDLAALARRPWKKLRRDHAALGPDPSDETLHALRIRAKRARYAVEAVADAVGGERPHALASALTGLQDVLGAHQDAVVAQAWLRAHVGAAHGVDDNGDRPTPAETFAAGMLAGLLHADALAAVEQLPRAWRRTDHRKLRAWME